MAIPAQARELGYAATHGHADFVADHLCPGTAITLAPERLAERIVALTFDDGPDPANDARILEILAAHHAAATFFVVGRNARQHPDTLRRILAAGHELGNHTQDHRRLSELPPAAQAAALKDTNALLAAAGVRPHWFRPPFGSYDEHTLAIARAAGLDTVLWTLDSKDYRGLAPLLLEERVIAGLTPGTIVLMHSTHRNTVEALPGILRRAAAAGYRFVTMTEWEERMRQAVTARP